MKLKFLLLMCVPLLFAGCREAPDGITHYRFGNKTDRIVEVMSYGVDADNNPVRIEHSFELAPGEEHEITYYGSIAQMVPPFNSSRYVKISNGEREVIFYGFPTNDGQKTYLYEKESYQIVKSKKHEVWYRYDFTDADFRDGTPVTEE